MTDGKLHALSRHHAEDDQIGTCEYCGKAIMPGEKYLYGGEDSLWFCEKHSATLKDQIEWYSEMIADGGWEDYFDDLTALENALDRAETEYLATGNRTLATA